MLLKINKELLGEAMASIGAHPVSLPIFTHKSEIVPYKLLGVRTPAANILKQEMLAAGGAAVVPPDGGQCLCIRPAGGDRSCKSGDDRPHLDKFPYEIERN